MFPIKVRLGRLCVRGFRATRSISIKLQIDMTWKGSMVYDFTVNQDSHLPFYSNIDRKRQHQCKKQNSRGKKFLPLAHLLWLCLQSIVSIVSVFIPRPLVSLVLSSSFMSLCSAHSWLSECFQSCCPGAVSRPQQEQASKTCGTTENWFFWLIIKSRQNKTEKCVLQTNKRYLIVKITVKAMCEYLQHLRGRSKPF